MMKMFRLFIGYSITLAGGIPVTWYTASMGHNRGTLLAIAGMLFGGFTAECWAMEAEE